MTNLNVYTASPTLIADPGLNVWQPMNWLASNGVLMKVLDDDLPPTMRDDFAETIMALPEQRTGINLEPAQGGWKYLNGLTYPYEAAGTFEMVAEHIRELRPDLDFFFYTLPQRSMGAVTNPEQYGLSIMEREIGFMAATQYMQTVAVSGYWKSGTWDDWKRHQDFAIGLAALHNKTLVAFVWDRHPSQVWQNPTTPEEFKQILAYYKARDISVIYWSSWTTPQPVHWETQFALWEFTQ